MSIPDRAELIVETKKLVGLSFDKISDIGWDRVAVQTELELGFAYPISDSGKEFWQVERCKRHFINVLLIESAHKFQYKKYYLQHRFKHYIQLIKQMDDDFYKAVEDNTSGIFDDIVSVYPANGFLDYMNAGFIYDNLGRDSTYLNDRVV